jgi:6-phosphogluconolactonase
MAREALLANVPIPAENVYRMPAEQPDPDSAAQAYEAELRQAFGIGAQAWPRFDLVLLGMGADGHCASLFPRKPALRETTRLVVATEPGLEPFVPRLTLTYPVLNQAANVVFLVAGAEKAQTLARVLEGPFDPDALPAQAVAPSDGTLTWLFDTAVATRLQAF